MRKLFDQRDKDEDEDLKDLREKNEQKSVYKKLWAYNNPKSLIFISMVAALVSGCG